MIDSLTQIQVSILPDGRMRRREAAKYIGVAYRTLIGWDQEKKGPRSLLVGGLRFYRKADLDAFVAGQR